MLFIQSSYGYSLEKLKEYTYTTSMIEKMFMFNQKRALLEVNIDKDIIDAYINIYINKSNKFDKDITIKIPKNPIISDSFTLGINAKSMSNNDKLYIFIPSLRNPFVVEINPLDNDTFNYSFQISNICSDSSNVDIYAILKSSQGKISSNIAKLRLLNSDSMLAIEQPQCRDHYNSSIEEVISKRISKIKNIPFLKKIKFKRSKSKDKLLIRGKSKLHKNKNYFSQAEIKEDNKTTLKLKLSENIKNLSFKLPAKAASKEVSMKLVYTDGREINKTLK